MTAVNRTDGLIANLHATYEHHLFHRLEAHREAMSSSTP